MAPLACVAVVVVWLAKSGAIEQLYGTKVTCE
jgi:hypothetical protein